MNGIFSFTTFTENQSSKGKVRLHLPATIKAERKKKAFMSI